MKRICVKIKVTRPGLTYDSIGNMDQNDISQILKQLLPQRTFPRKVNFRN